jgi:hypothetical protein
MERMQCAKEKKSKIFSHLDEGHEVGEEFLEGVAERVVLRLERLRVALVLQPDPEKINAEAESEECRRGRGKA